MREAKGEDNNPESLALDSNGNACVAARFLESVNPVARYLPFNFSIPLVSPSFVRFFAPEAREQQASQARHWEQLSWPAYWPAQVLGRPLVSLLLREVRFWSKKLIACPPQRDKRPNFTRSTILWSTVISAVVCHKN
jgi:hypothetical protein